MGCDCPIDYYSQVMEARSMTQDGQGAALIAAERARQRTKWDAAHDAGHQDGSLAVVAATLATEGTDARVEDLAGWRGSPDDPWGLPSKYSGDRVRQLVIAGALIAAEIDRLLQARGAVSVEVSAVDPGATERPQEPIRATLNDSSNTTSRPAAPPAGERKNADV